jgi:hypothetical protein
MAADGEIRSPGSHALGIAVFTFQAKVRVPGIIAHLRSLRSAGFAGPILIVDNNSQDGTYEELTACLPDSIGLVREQRRGISQARDRGVSELASCEWIMFLDDDMRVEPLDLVRFAAQLAVEAPSTFVIAPRVVIPMSAEQEARLANCLGCLPMQDFGTIPRVLSVAQWEFPMGGGMVIRRAPWMQSVRGKVLLQGRINGSRIGTEDREACLLLFAAGGALRYEPALIVQHNVEARRMDAVEFQRQAFFDAIGNGYLCRLASSLGLRKQLGWPGLGASIANLCRSCLGTLLRGRKGRELLNANRLGMVMGCLPPWMEFLQPSLWRISRVTVGWTSR